MIIAVADLHLGSHLANKSGFYDFMHNFLEPNQNDISHIVLLGDILDLWRYRNSEVLQQNFDVLTELGRLDMTKNYLAGNHDYAIFNLLNKNASLANPGSAGVLDQVSETLEIQYDGIKLRFIHGHQVDYWAALSFYEVFSQAMCLVDDDNQDLSDVWNIIYRFAETLPENTRNKVRNISHETQIAIEAKLAGPFGGNMQEEKKGLQYEWDLLREVSDFEDVAQRSSRLLIEIEKLNTDWEQLLHNLDLYSSKTLLPPSLANDAHQKRRDAASLTVGLQEDEFLIRGHGHTPYISQEAMVADAGCWLGGQWSYLKIEDGKVSVHIWK
ncbi:MAG: hypothetical protein ACFFCX_09450 [Candidatus Sifarchaeia archaeon]